MPKTRKPNKTRRMSRKTLRQRFPVADALLDQVVDAFKQEPDVQAVRVVVRAEDGQQ